MAKSINDLIGKNFGKLTVINRAKDIVSPSGKSKSIAWLCKCECVNEIIVKQSTLKNESHLIRSCGCSKISNPNYKGKHLSSEEVTYWEKLYDYVNYQIMGYKKNMLSSYMISRLKGLREGKYFQNTQQDVEGIYPSKVILNTFKFCMPNIQRALNNNSFKDEKHKFNYILKIVEDNLNNVYIRMKNVEKVKEEADNLDVSNTAEYVNTFKAKNDTSKASDKYNDLW